MTLKAFCTERNDKRFYIKLKTLGNVSGIREKIRAVQKIFFADLRTRDNYAK